MYSRYIVSIKSLEAIISKQRSNMDNKDDTNNSYNINDNAINDY